LPEARTAVAAVRAFFWFGIHGKQTDAAEAAIHNSKVRLASAVPIEQTRKNATIHEKFTNHQKQNPQNTSKKTHR
jgi:hypothetical protein